MHSFTANCDTFSNEEKVAAVVPVQFSSEQLNALELYFDGEHHVDISQSSQFLYDQLYYPLT